MKAVARTFLAVMLAVLVGFALVPGLHALAQEQDAEQGAAVQDAIRSMDYNGSIAAGATLTGVGFQVTM